MSAQSQSIVYESSFAESAAGKFNFERNWSRNIWDLLTKVSISHFFFYLEISSHLVLKNFRENSTIFTFMSRYADEINRLTIEFDSVKDEICKLKLGLVNAVPLISCQQLTLLSTNTFAQQNAGCLEWLFKLLPNIVDLSISPNLIHCLDSSTAPTLFINIKHLNFANEPSSEVDWEKLQTLHFPNITGFSISSVEIFRINRDSIRLLEPFCNTNPSLSVISSMTNNKYKNFEIIRLSATATAKRGRFVLFKRLKEELSDE